MQNMRNQSVVALWHYTIIVLTPKLKTNFSYIKTLIFDLFFKWFLMPLILQTLSRPVSNQICYFGVLLYFNSIIHYIKLSSVF